MRVVVEDVNGNYKERLFVPFACREPEKTTYEQIRMVLEAVDEAIEEALWRANPVKKEEV